MKTHKEYNEQWPSDQVWPDCYLHVRDEKSGEEWIKPIRGNGLIDLAHNLKKWVRAEFGGELWIDWPLMPRLSGDYYAKILTDGRAPDSVIVWESGGFYLKPAGRD